MKQMIETSFGKICCQDSGGAGRELIFLHTNSSSSLIFAEQMASKALKGFRCIAFDFPGHGDSDNAQKPESTYTITAFAKLLLELIDILNVVKPVLVGCSLGGHVALEAAAQAPERFSGLFIVGTPPFGPGIENIDKAFLEGDDMSLTGKPEWSDQEVIKYAHACLGSNAILDKELLRVLARTDGKAREVMLNHWGSGVEGYKQVDFISQSEIPLAVLHGSADQLVALDYLQSLEWNNLWRGKVQVLEGLPHIPFLQDSFSFNNLLNQFLQELETSNDFS